MDKFEILRKAAAQGIVLLRNKNDTLPFTQSDNVAVFGRCQVDYYKSGTGSGGSVHVPFSINFIEGMNNLKKENFAVPSLNEELVKIYSEWLKEHPFDAGQGAWASEPWSQVEMALGEEIVKNASSKSNKAVFIVGRTAGEDQDNKAEPGSFLLTETERKNIELICSYFERVAIIFNTSNIMDLSWIDDPAFKSHITSVLFSWQGGMMGGQGLCDVLCGKENPSGKLPDSIAYKIEDYPSSKNFGHKDFLLYEEDIYVGYRYFTTFAKNKIQFPFGFGLSYTSFELSDESYTFSNSAVSVRAKVTNTGSKNGREVVQVYAECPQGKLGKSSRVLCGFAKTKELAPKESQELQISFPLSRFSSYDDSGVTGFAYSYVLEEGEYNFYAGTDCISCKKVQPADSEPFTVKKTYALETLSQCCAPSQEFTRIRPGKLGSDGLYIEEKESVPLSKVDIAQKIKTNTPAEIPFKKTSITFTDVIADKSRIDEFIGNLSDNELMTLVRGEGMMSRKVTAGIASAFGGLSDELHARNVPAVGCSDGPSGIRMDNGTKAILLPIGTSLASSWDSELVEDVYGVLGNELKENKIDVLLGPGCNIHRNPLNGRNFEYYSEDPLVSGIMAAAACKGLARAGAIGTIKHFALNNQEKNRRNVDSVASERAIREIYLKPFEIAIKEGNARSLMTAYNTVNGFKAASYYDLNTSILRGEWGFTGVVMTDWWATMNDCIKGGKSDGLQFSEMLKARNDLYMVCVNDTADKGGFGDNMEESLKNGNLSKAQLQLCAKDILLFITETFVAKAPLRPLRNEVFVESNITSVPEGANLISGRPAFAKDLVEPVYFNIKKGGEYRIYGSFRKDGGDTLSQSITNVLINGKPLGSFECRSTGGKKSFAVAAFLNLKPGIYKVELEHTKPGIEVMELGFWQDMESPITTGFFEKLEKEMEERDKNK